jgi:hypothetical protein
MGFPYRRKARYRQAYTGIHITNVGRASGMEARIAVGPTHKWGLLHFRWWRGLQGFVRRPDLGQREGTGSRAMHMQPPAWHYSIGHLQLGVPETRHCYWTFDDLGVEQLHP